MRRIEANTKPTEEKPALLLFCLLLAALMPVVNLPFSPAFAQPGGTLRSNGGEAEWRTEFDELCSRVDGAMDLSQEELERLCCRCRALEPRIEQLPDTPKKVFSRKLRRCRDLYQFVLEQRFGAAAERGGGNAGGRDAQ